MDVRYLIFALSSSFLGFLYVYLSVLVILQRRKFKIAYLTNDNKAFIARVRAHGNFSEYVPLGLILMAVSITLDIHALALWILAVFFVLGRFVHAYGLIRKESKRNFNYRFFGMICTFFVMLVFATYNLFKVFLYWIPALM